MADKSEKKSNREIRKPKKNKEKEKKASEPATAAEVISQSKKTK